MFKKREPELPPRPTQPIDYPDGLAVETEKGLYYIKNKKKFRFFSERVFDTWSLEPVRSSEQAVKHMPRAGVLGFRDGSLIQDYSDGKLYIIAGNRRRMITSPDVLEVLGRDYDDVVAASREEIELHDEGDPIGWHITL